MTGHARVVLERYMITNEIKELTAAKQYQETFDKVREHLEVEFQESPSTLLHAPVEVFKATGR